jgi:hypothetical protein
MLRLRALLDHGTSERARHVNYDSAIVVIMVRARHVDDDFAVFRFGVLFDGGEGAKQEAVDVSEDDGASGGDAALLEGEGEIPEVGVDVFGRATLGEILSQQRGEIRGVVTLGSGVTGAKSGMHGSQRGATLPARGRLVLAAVCIVSAGFC